MSIREFSFTFQDFEFLRALVNECTGINLSEHKQEMLYSRLSRRLRALKLESFKEYCELLKSRDEREMNHFINAVTTNLTAFFREPHHFEFLKEVALPALMQRRQVGRRLRIWSAGCASGEEPFCIAMMVKQVVPSHWDVKILATDLDSGVLEKAKLGIYEGERLEPIPSALVQRWFKPLGGDQWQVVSELQQMVVFNRLNLIEPWPMQKTLDIIFCRNVVIYFNKETQRSLFERFAGLLANDGYLFIGHSENLFQISELFALLQKTVYTKISV